MKSKIVLFFVILSCAEVLMLYINSGFECYGVICPKETESCTKHQQTNLQQTKYTITCLGANERKLYEHINIQKTDQRDYSRTIPCYGEICPAGTALCEKQILVNNVTTRRLSIQCLGPNQDLIHEFLYIIPLEVAKRQNFS